MQGKLFVISGPSGSGKSSICKKLAKEKDIKISISATTRAPRKNEKDGVNYYFLKEKEFDEKIDNNSFYEYAVVYGNKYGTLKEKVDAQLKNGFNVILEIDIQGALQIKKIKKDTVLIFIVPPSNEHLKQRLSLRDTDSKEEQELRLKEAREELSKKDLYDYVITNHVLNDACKEALEIIRKK